MNNVIRLGFKSLFSVRFTEEECKHFKGKKLLPASILYRYIAGRYRPVSYPDGPIMARYRFIKNAYWVSKLVCDSF